MSKNIAILLGGNSSEYIISEKSAEEIFSVLKTTNFTPYKIRVRNGKWTYLGENNYQQELDTNDFSILLADGNKINFDYAFIIIHGTPGEDGKIQAFLDLQNIPYNTPGVLSSAISFNKYYCKVFLKNYDILTPEAFLFRAKEKIDTEKIISQTGLPVFVKPNNGGSSFGTNKVNKEEDLEEAINEALKEDDEVIIEAFVKGTELSCGLLKTSTEEIIFPITEISTKNEFFDFQAKYTEGFSEEITPARIPLEIEQKCQKIASDIYDFLNCKGIVRVDFILRGNQLYFLEINTVPGMSKESIIPKQIRANNMLVSEILEKVIKDKL